jgi:large subunit ribosomal protein L15
MGRTRKFRGAGSRTHGRGKKGGRGKGLRGGRGNAGLHKHRFLTYVKYMPGHFGRHGFKRPQKMVAQPITINVCDIEEILDSQNRLEEMKKTEGAVSMDGDRTVLDLTKLGFDKLLGKGRIGKPCRILVEGASPGAVKKIEEAGGEVILQEQK